MSAPSIIIFEKFLRYCTIRILCVNVCTEIGYV
nr:MAG TPA: hypothetical protein [Caudoviricetes sp.]